jgi:hypothetical protein
MCTVVATHHVSIRHVSNVVNIAVRLDFSSFCRLPGMQDSPYIVPILSRDHTRWPLALVIPQTTSRRSNRRRQPPLLLWLCMARGGDRGAHRQLEVAAQCLGQQRGSHLGRLQCAAARRPPAAQCSPLSTPSHKGSYSPAATLAQTSSRPLHQMEAPLCAPPSAGARTFSLLRPLLDVVPLLLPAFPGRVICLKRIYNF